MRATFVVTKSRPAAEDPDVDEDACGAIELRLDSSEDLQEGVAHLVVVNAQEFGALEVGAIVEVTITIHIPADRFFPAVES